MNSRYFLITLGVLFFAINTAVSSYSFSSCSESEHEENIFISWQAADDSHCDDEHDSCPAHHKHNCCSSHYVVLKSVKINLNSDSQSTLITHHKNFNKPSPFLDGPFQPPRA